MVTNLTKDGGADKERGMHLSAKPSPESFKHGRKTTRENQVLSTDINTVWPPDAYNILFNQLLVRFSEPTL